MFVRRFGGEIDMSYLFQMGEVAMIVVAGVSMGDFLRPEPGA